MDAAEILRLIGDRETDRVERKGSLANVDRVCEAICAFVDDLPGHGAPGVAAVGVDRCPTFWDLEEGSGAHVETGVSFV